VDLNVAIDLGRDALLLVLVVASPVLLMGLCVGLMIAVFQAMTQLQEQTLTFVPKIAAMAECHHIPVCPHNPSGPVANAATLQLAACTPNFAFLETMNADVPWRKDITDEHVVFQDGKMRIPDKPGLGIEINEEAIAQYPYHAHDLRHYTGKLTDIRPPEACSYFHDA